MRGSIVATACALILCCLIWTIDRASAQVIDDAAIKRLSEILPTFVGVTRSGTPIAAYITRDDLDIHVKKTRVLLIAGLDGSQHTTRAAMNILHRFYTEVEFEPLRKHVALSIVPCGNPDGQAKGLRGDNGLGGDPSRGYPPSGEAYQHPTNPEAQYLWRWIGMHAPDIAIELVEHRNPQAAEAEFVFQTEEDGLTVQLSDVAACQVGSVTTYQLAITPGNLTPLKQIASGILEEFNKPDFKPGKVDYSPARLELQARDRRSTIEVCQQLAAVYGHELPTVAYIPAVACIGRLRLAKLVNDPATLPDLQRITSDYLNGTKPTLTEKSGGSEFAGHILWSELYRATGNTQYIKLAQQAADRAFSPDGRPLEAMPTHSEMSDSVFMGCPILAQVGSLTGDDKYYDMCLQHMRFMLKLNLRRDGLHRHSPLDETAWGRGNGFPALGLALALEEIPQNHPGRSEMLAAFRDHLRALLPHQDPTGAWHQVVDHPESYRELTCTCMITYAMLRGIRRGWLPRDDYLPAVERGWRAVKARVASNGALVDVCTGTGKQKSLRDYLDRTAILGPDPRGGAMALLVATEHAAWEAEQK